MNIRENILKPVKAVTYIYIFTQNLGYSSPPFLWFLPGESQPLFVTLPLDTSVKSDYMMVALYIEGGYLKLRENDQVS